MRTISTDLKNHIMSGETTLALCWEIERTDGQTYRYTDHDTDIEYGGNTYRPISAGEMTAVKTTSGLAVDNMDIQIFFGDDVTRADIESGLFDGATIRTFMINYADAGQGVMKLSSGVLGEFSVGDDAVTVEFRSLSQLAQQPTGRIFGYQCDAELGDTRCGLTISATSGTVESVASNSEFSDSSISGADGYYDYGVLTWTSGQNAGRKSEVKRFESGTFTLVRPTYYPIAVDDEYEVLPGCDKQFSTCKDKFSNVENFRGFPHIPGQDKALEYPDAK